jgi:hypothetical protein
MPRPATHYNPSCDSSTVHVWTVKDKVALSHISHQPLQLLPSQERTPGTVTTLQAERFRNCVVPSRRDIFLLQNVQLDLVTTQPHTQHLPGIEQLWCQSNHSPWFCAEWSHTYILSLVCLQGMPSYNFTFILVFTCVPGSYFIHKPSMFYLTNWQNCEIKLPRKIPNFDVWHPVMLSVVTALIHSQAELCINKQLFTLL